jgi:hypothetical protein
MKKYNIFIALCALICASQVNAQGIYFDPSPTDVTANVRLYVDISSAECNCPNVQSVTPEDPLFIWTWMPAEVRPLLFGNDDVGNGDWAMSNENLAMTQDPDDPNLWYFDFLGASPAQFYDQPAAVFYQSGMSFLVKKQDGNGDPEPKSPDLSIIPEPVGCVEVICPFPLTVFQDEFAIFTYNNGIETNPGLQNMAPDEAYAIFRYRVNGGAELLYPPSPADANAADWQMEYDGEGIFSVTMVPQEFFPVNPGDVITEVRMIVTKFPLPAPPFNASTPLPVGCQ